jgi:hypothetical protein
VYRIRRISAIRAANVLAMALALPYGLIALLAIPFLGVTTTVTSNGQVVSSSTSYAPFLGLFVAWLSVALTTWVSVAIACSVYNFVAGRIGGIEIALEPAAPQ